ncbi:hypothetical protein OEZ85_013643 [Tetradesmus obliquus]|uniref:Protein kinase domain-containing protein n=1 Tax=Tetradesmus obliquus TaxID=3088 RepID=A0ABY8UTM8_TETOB|nr:hypothetical protein OEZ85_013643 [Tetradesmus obliquus]
MKRQGPGRLWALLLSLAFAGAWSALSVPAAAAAAAAAGPPAAAAPSSSSNPTPFLAMLNMAGVAKLLANTTTWANQASNPAWYNANLMNPNWPATIFMPSDQALTKLLRDAKSSASNQQVLDAFAANMPQFWQLMSNQVVDGTVRVEEGQEFTALGGEKLTVKKDAATGSWTLNGVSTPRWRRRRGGASRGLGCLGLGFCGSKAQNRGLGDAKDVAAGGSAGDVKIPVLPMPAAAAAAAAAGPAAGGLGVVHSGGALVAVGSGRVPTVIAPLPNAHHNDDSSDEEDDDAAAENDVASWRHHRHHHKHHGHKLNGAVQEGFEGDGEGLGFSSDTKTRDLEEGGFAAGAAAAAAGGVAAAGWQQHKAQQQQQQLQRGLAAAAPVTATDSCDSAADMNGSYYPSMAGGLKQPYDSAPVPQATVPTATEQQLQSFMSNWQAAGCPGGRLLALPTLSTVLPQGSYAAQGLGQGFGSVAPVFNDFAAGDAAAAGSTDHADQDVSGRSNTSDLSNMQGSVAAGFEVDDSVARLGSWAVEALKPGGPGDKQPLLRQVVGDIASGRHPVTHNFCFEEHQSPVARRNTLVLFAHNKNNMKRATIKFYTPRSPGYAAETSAYYQMASRHLPYLESTFNAPDGSYASALVLECGERSLQDMLQKQRPTDLPRKLEMFHQLVLNVRHMHSHNLVHRDLQPKHLLFCSEGLAWKLIDFSTTVTANCMVVPEVFSLEYCAPEVAAAVARGDRAMVACGAADMWAVGVIAYQLATGQPFYPASWSNEDIWRALLGLSPLPSELVDVVGQAAPGEKAYMKKVSSLLKRCPLQRLTAERLASSRMFSAVTATTTNVPLHTVQQAELDKDSGLRNELIRRMISMQHKLEHLGGAVDESKAVGLGILKEMTVNSLILSVNLQELRPLNPAAAAAAGSRSRHPLDEHVPGSAAAAAATAGGKGCPSEPPGGQVLTAGLTIGQAGALGLVNKEPAPLADDGAGNPVFLLRQGSQYLVELTVMHAKGQQLPDATAIESLQLEAPDKSKQSLQLGPTCRSRSQLMVRGNGGQGLRGFGQVEPVWVNSELTVRVCPADTSFKAVRAFKYMEECWAALPPEARGVMQGLVLLVRGVAGGASALATMVR